MTINIYFCACKGIFLKNFIFFVSTVIVTCGLKLNLILDINLISKLHTSKVVTVWIYFTYAFLLCLFLVTTKNSLCWIAYKLIYIFKSLSLNIFFPYFFHFFLGWKFVILFKFNIVLYSLLNLLMS